jgi:hypothetical protein
MKNNFWKRFWIDHSKKVEPLFECNGFCGTNDLNKRSETEKEINYGTSI